MIGAERLWMKWLRRRSQPARFGWDKAQRLLTRYPLPTPTILKPVDALRIAHAERFQNPLQSCFGIRDGQEMNRVGHQTVGQNVNPVFVEIIFHPIPINQSKYARRRDVPRLPCRGPAVCRPYGISWHGA